MFLKYKVDIPVVPGKLVRKNRGGHTYIEYEYDRIYDPVNFHIYYSDGKAYSEKQEIKQRIRRLKKYLDSCVGKECEPFGPEIGKYFHLNYEKDGKTLKLAEEKVSDFLHGLTLPQWKRNCPWLDILPLFPRII